MGIFSKQSRAKSQRSTTTLIAKGSTINGQLRLESDIQIDGLIEGLLHVDKTIIISHGGVVRGDLYASHVIINGEFEGTCYVDKIEILSKGRVSGSIYSDDLSIEPGGRFNGVTHAAPDKQVLELQNADLTEDKIEMSILPETTKAPKSKK